MISMKQLTESDIKGIRILADEGDASAQYAYARILNASKDFDAIKIVSYLKRSAKQGNTKALYMLAYFLFFGEGIEKDIEQSEQNCSKATIHGYTPAKRFLRTIEEYKLLTTKMHEPAVAYKAIYMSIKQRDTQIIEPLLEEDVYFIDCLLKPVQGKKEVIKLLANKFDILSKKKIKDQVNYIPTPRYGTIVEHYTNGYRRSLILCRVNQEGKIDRITRQPSNWGLNMEGIYINAGSQPLTRTNLLIKDNGYHKGHMFCMNCGTLSEDLKWVRCSKNIPKFGITLEGRMSICPKCQKEVEFIFEKSNTLSKFADINH